MKILFLYRNLALGGVQARIALLSQALAARGHDVFVATYGKPQPVAWPLDAGVTHLDLGGGSLPRRLWRLHGHIGRLKPDVVISATPHGNLLSLGLKLLGRHRFFTILSEESDPVEEARHAHGIHKLPFLLTSQLYPLADRIVAVSQGVRDQLCKQSGMAPKRISVIYNPIYRSDIEMLAGEAVSHRWFGGNFKVFLAAGRFVEQKNLALLLDSFARVHTQMPEARLILIGESSWTSPASMAAFPDSSTSSSASSCSFSTTSERTASRTSSASICSKSSRSATDANPPSSPPRPPWPDGMT